MKKREPEIHVKFMGRSFISLGGQRLVFPYLKVRLLFLILLESRAVSRGKLCRLLWDDDDEKGRRSLSNALSRLNHIMPSSLLCTDHRTVTVNPKWSVTSDLDRLSFEVLDLRNVQELLAPFLEDIEFTDPCFAWVQERRQYYQSKLRTSIEQKIASAEERDKASWQNHLDFLKLKYEEQNDSETEREALKEFPRQEGKAFSFEKTPSFEKELSFEEEDFLDCVAVFKGEAPFEDLKRLSMRGDRDLLSLYEMLSRKKILAERKNGSGNFTILFVSPSLKEQVRDGMSAVKWWKLNQKLVSILRRRLKNRPNLEELALLAHYSGECGETAMELEAEIRYLHFYFELTYELFPVLNDSEVAGQAPPEGNLRFSEDFLNNIQSTLDKLIRQEGRTARFVEFEREILILQGGFFRWSGRYADALNCLEEAMKLAFTSSDRTNSILEALEQLCYLGIQKDDSSLLRKYAFNFYRQALGGHVHPQLGMALRFLAILNTMEADYERAEKLLDMSIRLFEKLEAHGNVYTLSLIAAIQYKGDIALHRRNYKVAFDHYLRCIKLCDGKEFHRIQGLHLAKLSWCAIRMERFGDMKKYLDSALLYIHKAQPSLGSGTCGGEFIFALSALMHVKEGDVPDAARELRQAVTMSTVIQKPFWNALFFCLLALLKKYAAPEATQCLDNSSEYYLEKSRQLFEYLRLERENEAFAQLEKFLRKGSLEFK